MSWFVWFLITTVGFIIQVKGGAGPASAILAISAVACLGVFIYSFARSRKEGFHYIKYSHTEWASFILALFVFVFYITTKNAVLSIILVALIDTLGFLPTYVKTWRDPYSETTFLYIISFIKYGLVLLTLSTFSMETAFYPAVLVATNLGYTVFAEYRRHHMYKKSLN
jgi:hypothetical protein